MVTGTWLPWDVVAVAGLSFPGLAGNFAFRNGERTGPSLPGAGLPRLSW